MADAAAARRRSPRVDRQANVVVQVKQDTCGNRKLVVAASNDICDLSDGSRSADFAENGCKGPHQQAAPGLDAAMRLQAGSSCVVHTERPRVSLLLEHPGGALLGADDVIAAVLHPVGVAAGMEESNSGEIGGGEGKTASRADLPSADTPAPLLNCDYCLKLMDLGASCSEGGPRSTVTVDNPSNYGTGEEQQQRHDTHTKDGKRDEVVSPREQRRRRRRRRVYDNFLPETISLIMADACWNQEVLGLHTQTPGEGEEQSLAVATNLDYCRCAGRCGDVVGGGSSHHGGLLRRIHQVYCSRQCRDNAAWDYHELEEDALAAFYDEGIILSGERDATNHRCRSSSESPAASPGSAHLSAPAQDQSLELDEPEAALLRIALRMLLTDASSMLRSSVMPFDSDNVASTNECDDGHVEESNTVPMSSTTTSKGITTGTSSAMVVLHPAMASMVVRGQFAVYTPRDGDAFAAWADNAGSHIKVTSGESAESAGGATKKGTLGLFQRLHDAVVSSDVFSFTLSYVAQRLFHASNIPVTSSCRTTLLRPAMEGVERSGVGEVESCDMEAMDGRIARGPSSMEASMPAVLLWYAAKAQRNMVSVGINPWRTLKGAIGARLGAAVRCCRGDKKGEPSSKRFPAADNSSRKKSPEGEECWYSYLLPCGTSTIFEMMDLAEPLASLQMSSRGLALYDVQSAMDHACPRSRECNIVQRHNIDPSAVGKNSSTSGRSNSDSCCGGARRVHGTTGNMISLLMTRNSDAARGEGTELRLAYIEDDMCSTEARAGYLSSHYGFQCDCSLCGEVVGLPTQATLPTNGPPTEESPPVSLDEVVVVVDDERSSTTTTATNNNNKYNINRNGEEAIIFPSLSGLQTVPYWAFDGVHQTCASALFLLHAVADAVKLAQTSQHTTANPPQTPMGVPPEDILGAAFDKLSSVCAATTTAIEALSTQLDKLPSSRRESSSGVKLPFLMRKKLAHALSYARSEVATMIEQVLAPATPLSTVAGGKSIDDECGDSTTRAGCSFLMLVAAVLYPALMERDDTSTIESIDGEKNVVENDELAVLALDSVQQQQHIAAHVGDGFTIGETVVLFKRLRDVMSRVGARPKDTSALLPSCLGPGDDVGLAVPCVWTSDTLVASAVDNLLARCTSVKLRVDEDHACRLRVLPSVDENMALMERVLVLVVVACFVSTLQQAWR